MVVVNGNVVVVVKGVHDGQSPTFKTLVVPVTVIIGVVEHIIVLADDGRVYGDTFVSPQHGVKLRIAFLVPVFVI